MNKQLIDWLESRGFKKRGKQYIHPDGVIVNIGKNDDFDYTVEPPKFPITEVDKFRFGRAMKLFWELDRFVKAQLETATNCNQLKMEVIK